MHIKKWIFLILYLRLVRFGLLANVNKLSKFVTAELNTLIIILKADKVEHLQHVRHDVGLQQRVQESRLLNVRFDQSSNLQPERWRILFGLGLEGSGFVGPSQRSRVQRKRSR